MSSPTFFKEGSQPSRSDTNWRVSQKILGALIDGGISGGDGGGEVAVEADMYWPGVGSGTVTVAQLNAQRYGGAGGTFTIPTGVANVDDDITFSASAALSNLRNPISVEGEEYPGDEETGFAIDMANKAVSEVRWGMPSEQDNVLVGFFLKNNPDLNFTPLDVFGIEAADGSDHATVQWRQNSPPIMNAHSEAGSGVGDPITVVSNVLYWVQLKYARGVAATVAVWRVSDWSLIGVSSNPLDDVPAGRFIGPQIGQHGTTSNSSILTSKYVFKWSGDVPPADELWI